MNKTKNYEIVSDLNEVSYQHNDRSVLRIIGEAFVGSGVGLFLSVPPLIALQSIDKNQPTNFTLAFFYSTYIIGTSLGVYVIAKNGNRNLSFLPTLGYASLGGLFVTIPLIFKAKDSIALYLYLFPLLGAITYANVFAPFSEQVDNNISYSETKSTITHKDYYNHKLIFNINVFQISF